MSTHFPSTHDGLDRIIEGAAAARGVFSDIFSARQVPTYVLAFGVMAVVTATERALDAVQTGFAFEWAILTIVALLTFGLLARVVIHRTRAAQAWFADHARRARQTRSDGKLWDTARHDPRVMNDLLAAQGRSNEFLAERTPAKVLSGQVDEGLAPLAPWVQLTRYY